LYPNDAATRKEVRKQHRISTMEVLRQDGEARLLSRVEGETEASGSDERTLRHSDDGRFLEREPIQVRSTL
jgi:hypothetical protein